STAILILYGGLAVIHGEMPVSSFLALSLLLDRLVWPTLTLGFMLALVQRGRASWSRLVQLHETKTDVPDGTGPALLPSEAPARVEVKDLTIKIAEYTLLDKVTFELAPGTITAIVGRTGGGKSTLVEALCRLVDVPAGTIFFDGRDITTIPLASLRAQLGYAP